MIKSKSSAEAEWTRIGGRMPPTTIRWSGEFYLLRALGENEAFAALLKRLGYVLNNFRVTVRRITGDGRKEIRYNVFVDQLRNGQPFRGQVYLGGHGAEWIDQFELRASTDFPQTT